MGSPLSSPFARALAADPEEGANARARMGDPLSSRLVKKHKRDNGVSIALTLWSVDTRARSINQKFQ